MDSLELLHETRPTPDAPSAQATIDARAALMSAISAERAASPAVAGAGSSGNTPRPTARTGTRFPRRRRGRLGWGLAAGAAALAAGALVFSQTLLPLGTPGAPSPAVAAVLNQAADNAVKFSDPVLKPGQYLKVSRVARNVAEGEVLMADGRRSPAGYLQGADSDKYIPANSGAEWVWVSKPTGALSPAPGTTAEQFAQIKRDQRGLAGTVSYGTSRDGSFSEDEVSPGEVFPGQERPQDLPGTPEALLQHIYKVTEGSGQGRDREAFVWIVDRLGTDVPSASMRALYFRTLALIPGTELGASDAVLNGVRGTLVTAPSVQSGTVWQILIDPATGRYLGEREVGGYDYPDDFVSASETVTISVVNSVPKDPRASKH